MPGCPAVAPGGRGSAALVFPFLVIVAVGTGKTDGSACRRVTAAAISPAQGHRSASRSRRSAMTFPGSWTARGARHRASPADRPRARPVTRIASHSKTAPACETRPGRPPTPRRRRRVHYSSPEKVPSTRTGWGPRQALSSQVKGTFSFIPVAAAYSRRSPGLVKARALPHPAVLAMVGWGRLSCGCAVRVRSARTPGPGRHGHETSWMTF